MDRRGRPGKQLMEIGTDVLLGVWVDDLDIEQVRVYRILKG